MRLYNRINHCVRHLISLCCKHEGCSVELITFVNPKHHDEVLDYPRVLPNGNCHVQRMGVLFSTVERETRSQENVQEGTTDTFLVACTPTFQRYECWVSFQLGQCLAPQLLHFVVPLLLVPVPSATMTASQLLVCVQQMRFCLDSLVVPLLYRPLALLHHSGMLQALNNSAIHSQWLILACVYHPSIWYVPSLVTLPPTGGN